MQMKRTPVARQEEPKQRGKRDPEGTVFPPPPGGGGELPPTWREGERARVVKVVVVVGW